MFVNTEKIHYYYYGDKKIDLKLDEACSRRYNVPCFKDRVNSNTIMIADGKSFLVKLKRKEDIGLLRSIAVKKQVSILYQFEFMPLWYKLKIDKCALKASLEVANEFYETGYFAAVDFGFSTYERCTICNN